MKNYPAREVLGKVTGYTVKPLPVPTKFGQKYRVLVWVNEGREQDTPVGALTWGPHLELKVRGRNMPVARGDKVSLWVEQNGKFNNLLWSSSTIVL